MARWIEKICEPKSLFLAWQPAALDAPSRWRWAVGIVRPVGDDLELRYFEPGVEFERFNNGKKFEELLALGYIGYPAFPAPAAEYRSGVRQALLRRLPPRTRPDFAEYAGQFRLCNVERLSDFGLLARTEAKVPSDGFSVVDPLDPDSLECDLLLEIAGYRHYMNDVAALRIGDPIEIIAEPDSAFDPHAVATMADGTKVGNINRLQASTFLRWLDKRSVTATVERINGSSERPRVFIFVQVRPQDDQPQSETGTVLASA